MKEFYDSVYRANPQKWGHPARDEFAYKALSEVVSDPASLLDFGCGNGHTLRYFMDKWPETEYYGVDISSVALDIARKKVPSAKFSDSIGDFPMPNVITLLGVAEHFHKLSHIRWVADHLSPAGFLYVEVPNCLSYSDSQEEGFRKTYGSERTGQIEWHLRRESWEFIFAANRLRIVKSFTGKNPAWQFVWILQ